MEEQGRITEVIDHLPHNPYAGDVEKMKDELQKLNNLCAGKNRPEPHFDFGGRKVFNHKVEFNK